jgi:hypothetical protein
MDTTVVDAKQGSVCMLESDTRQVVNSVVIQQGLFARNMIKLCCTVNHTLIVFINVQFS